MVVLGDVFVVEGDYELVGEVVIVGCVVEIE